MDTTTPQDFVSLTIDGRALRVPKGTNLIEAARSVGIDIPHYCYHRHLSVAGNCRMCQVRVKGAPKLDIACGTAVREGMEVSTHHTSKEVADAQAAVLEFILLNHPLDCTVCDQAGHCKLQDYHYQYNARPSRFVEQKEHKVKATALGPTVMLDGERCIMCTRCIRFCDEITGTSELGMMNRGDRSVIAVDPKRPLDNPLSGTVVDLCPVGALTHRHWRFNTRLWFAEKSDSICPGCSTGCPVSVFVRDRRVVQVKARAHPEVNKEWLCDEGRYGFERFLPEERLLSPHLGGRIASWDEALVRAAEVLNSDLLILAAPDLLLEEYGLLSRFAASARTCRIALAYRERKLDRVAALLVSPDYAANFRGAQFAGIAYGDLEQSYNAALECIRQGQAKHVLLLGERAIGPADRDERLLKGLARAELVVAALCDRTSHIAQVAQVVFPGRSILEKSGLLINRQQRLQYADRVLLSPSGTEPEWKILDRIARVSGRGLSQAVSDRELSLEYLAQEPRLQGQSLAAIRAGGVALSF